MNPYDLYQKARSQRIDCENWHSLIGKQSSATAPHVGTISSSACKFTVHFQPYDGANNYHDAPKPLTDALESVLKTHSALLIGDALRILREKEAAALIACKEFASGIIAQIDAIEYQAEPAISDPSA